MIFILFSTLPFYIISKLIFPISIAYICIGCCAVLGGFKIIYRGKIEYNIIFNFIFLYLISILPSVIYSDSSSALFAFQKSVIFTLSSLLLYNYLANIPHDKLFKQIYLGSMIGCIILIALLLKYYLENDIGSISYYGLTFGFFGYIFELLSHDLERSRELMRNGVAEVFVLYSLIFLFSTRKSKIVGIFFSTILTVIMFSRRSFISLMVIFSTSILNKTKGIIRLYIMFALAVIAICLFMVMSHLESVRLFNLNDPARVEMFQIAGKIINEDVIFGQGYGAKLDGEKYVHNFVISSFYMSGIIPFLISLMIMLFMLKRVFSTIFFGVNRSNIFLTIPLFGFLVGSTVEGITTISGWLSIILVCYYDRNRPRLNQYERVYEGFN